MRRHIVGVCLAHFHPPVDDLFVRNIADRFQSAHHLDRARVRRVLSARTISCWCLGTVKSSENIFLNTSNSGLQDVLTTREILFGNHYKILPLSNPLLTASNGGFDVLAFQAPELLSGMKGFDIPISVAVKSGSSLVSIVESNKVLWSYDAPEITQISVKDHPTNINLLIVTVYGRNFGSAKLGPTPVDIYRVSLNRVQNNHETAIQMAFGNVAFLEGVQSWEQTAVRDKIVLVTDKVAL